MSMNRKLKLNDLKLVLNQKQITETEEHLAVNCLHYRRFLRQIEKACAAHASHDIISSLVRKALGKIPLVTKREDCPFCANHNSESP